jgi:hypothetical protein
MHEPPFLMQLGFSDLTDFQRVCSEKSEKRRLVIMLILAPDVSRQQVQPELRHVGTTAAAHAL